MRKGIGINRNIEIKYTAPVTTPRPSGLKYRENTIIIAFKNILITERSSDLVYYFNEYSLNHYPQALIAGL